ncbi:MAG: hypothetical protein KF789_09655 [Bdellovibrionaceae bacterium]|nr:hypothetical protein [Pseudobdellovibrionaceae bacterium]
MKTQFAVLLFPALFAVSAAHGAQEKVLIIGDSLTCGSFGDAMFEDLRSKGKEVHLFCTESSTAEHWLKGTNPKGKSCQTRAGSDSAKKKCQPGGNVPKLETLMAGLNPDQVVLALGTNYIGGSKKNEDASVALSKLATQNNKDCLWVGPPRSTKKVLEDGLDAFYNFLDERIQHRCSIVDSRDATAPGTAGAPTVDGIHRTKESGKKWYEAIATSITTARGSATAASPSGTGSPPPERGGSKTLVNQKPVQK